MRADLQAGLQSQRRRSVSPAALGTGARRLPEDHNQRRHAAQRAGGGRPLGTPFRAPAGCASARARVPRGRGFCAHARRGGRAGALPALAARSGCSFISCSAGTRRRGPRKQGRLRTGHAAGRGRQTRLRRACRPACWHASLPGTAGALQAPSARARARAAPGTPSEHREPCCSLGRLDAGTASAGIPAGGCTVARAHPSRASGARTRAHHARARAGGEDGSGVLCGARAARRVPRACGTRRRTCAARGGGFAAPASSSSESSMLSHLE